LVWNSIPASPYAHVSMCNYVAAASGSNIFKTGSMVKHLFSSLKATSWPIVQVYITSLRVSLVSGSGISAYLLTNLRKKLVNPRNLRSSCTLLGAGYKAIVLVFSFPDLISPFDTSYPKNCFSLVQNEHFVGLKASFVSRKQSKTTFNF